ncbi:monothiol glutaredoxin [Vairimorpha necatrix]|uniref:Monothiol glutaredoxin n=1 Tax=Vairimorpha necatrix TaxID=6039 RepID=A0AAX4JCV9_9MICR
MYLIPELDQEEDFYDLLEKDEIIIYEDQSRSFTKMTRYMSENAYKICVRSFPLLKRRLMFDLNIPILPVAIYYRHMILPNEPIKKLIHEINSLKYELLETRVNNMISKNQIHIFIEGTPKDTEFERTNHLMSIINKLNMTNISFGYYNCLLNRRLSNYICDFVNSRKLPFIFIDGQCLGTLEVFEEMFVQKKISHILKNLRDSK